MPSGAKKRKAAKKKKEKEANHNPDSSATTTHFHGNDDLTHHDEKESDGGEVSSPASQDHHTRQHPFSGSSSVQSFVDEIQSMEGVNNDDESMQRMAVGGAGVVQIDRELKHEDGSENKDVTIEYVEPMRKSNDGGLSGSSGSSSSSDDESHVVEKSPVVVETGHIVESIELVGSSFGVVSHVPDIISAGEAYNSIVETASVVDSDKVLVSKEVVRVNENASVENSFTSDVAESVLKENGEKKLASLVENTGVSSDVKDLISKEKGDIVVSTSDENAAISLDAKVSAVQEIEEKLFLSYDAPRVDTSVAKHINDCEATECSDNQVASPPRPVQTTSWKSCCGLFEVLTGSNR